MTASAFSQKFTTVC